MARILKLPLDDARRGAVTTAPQDVLAEDAFTRASIAQMLRACDFSEVACFEDRPVAHGARSALRAALWPLLRGVMRLFLAVETGEGGREAIFSQCLLAVARR